METQEQRCKRNVDILEYVCADLEIKENYQKYLKYEWGMYEIRKLRNISEDYFRVMEGNDAQIQGEY